MAAILATLPMWSWTRLWIIEMGNISKLVDGKRVVGAGIGFERIRRITGYLVGTLDRFNNAKRSEERDRVKHAGGCCRD